MSTETATAPSPVAARSLREVITHILDTHHAYLRGELPYFEQMIAKMCANHGQDRPELFATQQILQDLRDDLMAHLEKEEQVLFPYIAQLEDAQQHHLPGPEGCFPSVRYPIRMMLMEHDNVTDLLQNLRRTSNNYTAPDFACANGRAFFTRLENCEADLHEHIRLENEVLFPKAVELEESQR